MKTSTKFILLLVGATLIIIIPLLLISSKYEYNVNTYEGNKTWCVEENMQGEIVRFEC